MTTNPPPLAGTFGPPVEAIDAFQRDGHVVIRGLATADEVAPFRPAIAAAAAEQRWDHRPIEERETYFAAFLQSFNLWRHDPVVAHYVTAARFARVAAELLGVDGVRLYHDQALFKEVGGGHTPWHQDKGYWPITTDAMVTLWMPLTDITPESGTMTFASGSHLAGDIAAGDISDDSDAHIARVVAELAYEQIDHGAMNAGDASFHHGWTLHSAGPNTTDSVREAMTIIYVADGASVAEPTDQQRGDLRWLGGAQPGDPVDSELNPLLWPVPNAG